MGVCGVGEDFSGRLDVLTNNAFAFLHSVALEMAVECSLRRKKMREGLLGDHSYDKHVEHGHVRRGRETLRFRIGLEGPMVYFSCKN
jgi:hypothetical protein